MGLAVNARWLLVADSQLPWAAMILAAWDDVPHLTSQNGTDAAVLRVLLVEWQRCAGKKAETCFHVPQEELAEACAMTSRSVIKSIQRLRAAGLLGIRKGHRGAITYDVMPFLKAVRLVEAPPAKIVDLATGEEVSGLTDGRPEGVSPETGNLFGCHPKELRDCEPTDPPKKKGERRSARSERGLPLYTGQGLLNFKAAMKALGGGRR